MLLIYQIILVILLILISGSFAGSETAIYRLSRFRLRLAIQQKRPFSALLGKVMQDSHGLMLSVLIGNNLTNYLATSLVAFIFLSQLTSERATEIYTALIMTPVLFIFVDIIPKNVYYYAADTILLRLTPLLWAVYRLFTLSGVVTLLKTFSKLLTRLFGSDVDTQTAISETTRHNIRQIIQETHDEGIVSPLQQDIMHRLVSAPYIPARSVMIPMSLVHSVSVDTDSNQLLDELKKSAYTRLLVYQNDVNNIIGFINVYRALTSEKTFHDLHKFTTPILHLSNSVSVIEAIGTMRNNKTDIAVITTGHRTRPKFIGIVTIKDLIKELTGKLAP